MKRALWVILLGFAAVLYIGCGGSKAPSADTQNSVPVALSGDETADSSGEEREERAQFPIGVYFVRGQKPISDDDASNIRRYDCERTDADGNLFDFRIDPETAGCEYRHEFADLANEGINVAVMTIAPLAYGEHADEVVKAMLEEAKRNGIRLVIHLGNIQALLAEQREELHDEDIDAALQKDFFGLFENASSVLGYVIFDEPVPAGEPGIEGQFVKPEQLGKVRAYIEARDRDAVVLSPWANVDNMKVLQAGMQSKILYYDLYPFAEGTPTGDLSDAWPRGDAEEGSFAGGADQPTYTEYIEMTRNEIPDIPQWIVIQAFEQDEPHYWRMPQPKEMRLEIFLALAHGVKGIYYFLYQSEEWIDGIRDTNYQPGLLYDEMVSINRKISEMGETLLTIERIPDLNIEQPDGGEVHPFTDGEGRDYLFVVNTDVENKVTLHIRLPDNWKAKHAEDIYTKETIAIKNDTITLEVEPGDGRLLIL